MKSKSAPAKKLSLAPDIYSDDDLARDREKYFDRISMRKQYEKARDLENKIEQACKRAFGKGKKNGSK